MRKNRARNTCGNAAAGDAIGYGQEKPPIRRWRAIRRHRQNVICMVAPDRNRKPMAEARPGCKSRA